MYWMRSPPRNTKVQANTENGLKKANSTGWRHPGHLALLKNGGGDEHKWRTTQDKTANTYVIEIVI